MACGRSRGLGRPLTSVHTFRPGTSGGWRRIQFCRFRLLRFPTVSISVTGPQSGTTYYVGDSYVVTVIGPPNQPVTVNQTRASLVPNVTWQTNAQGVWSTSGTWTSSDVGTYTQTWSVAGVVASPTLRFSISQTSYTISGVVTMGGIPLPGVAIKRDGTAITATSSTGQYSLNVTPGSYLVAPFLAGYTFTPPSTPVTITTSSQTASFMVISGTVTGTPPAAPAPDPTPTPITPPVVSGSTQACGDISGTWTDAASDAFSLAQLGNAVSGSTTQPDARCGSVTWQITGQLNPDGTFTLTESNPNPPVDACGQTVQQSLTASATILNCSQLSETCISGSGSGCGGVAAASGGRLIRRSSLSIGKNPKGAAASTSTTWTRSSNPPGLQVTVDLNKGVVGAILSGRNKTGALTVKINGPQTTTLGQSNSAGPSTQEFSLKRTSLSPGQYSSVVANWDEISLNVPIGFNVLGPTRFSMYNTPAENLCTGTATPVYLFFFNTQGACAFDVGTLRSDFMTNTVLNGTGSSASYGLLKPFSATYLKNYCPLSTISGATSANTFVIGTPKTGTCNSIVASGVSLAVNPSPQTGGTWQCLDNVLLVNTSSDTVNSTMVVQDYCPACSGDFRGMNAHIDSYSANPTCGGHSATDYGNFTAIRLR